MADYAPYHAEQSPIGNEGEGKGRTASQQIANRYWREIGRYDRRGKDWFQEGDEINRKYRLERKKVDSNAQKSTPGVRQFQMLWSNVETLKPAVLAKCPTSVVSRRF